MKAIRKSDIPFLGLLGETLTLEMRQEMTKAIAAEPTVRGYINRLEFHPALFSVNLAWHVMQGMGQSGHFSLYPHIQEALCMDREPNQAEREQLWHAFRRALLHLGLEPSPRTSGPHFMVNEYLRQAGVPLPFVDDLARKMLSFARKVGMPDDDDPEGIVSWQAALDARLEMPFSQTARKSLAFDRHGYYTRIFLRVYAAGGVLRDATNKLDLAMEQAFKESGVSTLRRTVLPRVIFHDGYLGMFFPGGEEQEWTVTVDDVARQYRIGAEDRFFPISQPLPCEVVVRNQSNDQKMRVTLWEDDKSNRMLFFSDTGRLAGRGQLAQKEPLTLSPGSYIVLARFEPAGMNAEEITDEPRLFSFPLSLHPGKSHILSNGPVYLDVHADSEPLAYWRGDHHASKEGVEFLHGSVGLEVEVPSDWLSLDASFDLTLFPGERGEKQVIPLKLDANGRCVVSVSGMASEANWRPGLMRLLVELRRRSESRVLLRSSSLYWLGLNEISRELRFRCAAFPENLKLEFSENLVCSGDDLKPKDTNARGVRLVFALSEKRKQSLTWNMPGVFVEVEEVVESGLKNPIRRVLGSTESVSLTSAKQIVVSASDPGILSLGEWSQRVDFARHSIRMLSAAFLASRLTPQFNMLIYVNEVTGTELSLLRLTQPHEVNGFTTRVQGGQIDIRLHVSESLEALSVRVLALLSEEDDIFTLQANASEWTNTRFGRARLMVIGGNQGGYDAHLYINLDLWPAGAWLFNLDGQIKGVWGHLENSRQDVFAAGFLLGKGGQILSHQAWRDQVQVLEDKSACELLQRIHAALLVCYAQEAWDGLSWLVFTWKTLTERWRGREVMALTTLSDLVAMRPPEGVSTSWLPQLAIAATLPGLFALPAEEYRRVNEKAHPISRSLRAMGNVVAQWPSIFSDLLHFAFAAGFANFPAISKGALPKGFDPKRYCDAMRSVTELEYVYKLADDAFLPGPGDYLGPLHYRHAWRAMETAYENTLQGNGVWRGQGIGLAQHAHRVIPSLDGRFIPPCCQGQAPHLTPWPVNLDEAVDDQILQQRENLNHIAHLLASFAFACRQEVRQSGELSNYLNLLNKSNIPLDGPLAFLLQIGNALFAYYLLLWEVVLKADT
ncbi:hypothetical protein [uncultured Nitrosomonas sp.]|uniref:hypothetical protein n=1 Tax=uncultured Nitrosomonas sp. TaxID=156424 RepID=UPI0025CCE56E|nr:hypothetical protein [uncultured Nitrosomonas sp.]